MGRRRTWVIGGVLVALVVGGLAKCSGGPGGPGGPGSPGSTTSAAVERGRLVEVITATGVVVPKTLVKITTKASGTVVAVPVLPGASVTAGELLLELDPADELRNVERSKTAVAAATARVDQARITLDHDERSLVVSRARADATLASAQLAEQDAREKAVRTKALLAQGLVSAEEHSAALAAAASATARLAEAHLAFDDLTTQERQLASRRHDVAVAEGQLRSDELSLADAKARLAETRITAPIDGTLLTCSAEVGQVIASAISTVGAGGTPVMTVADLSRLQVKVEVPETDVGRLRPGQSVTVASEAFPGRSFPGEVVRVAPGGTRNEGFREKVTFETLVQVRDGDTPLRPEMTVTVDVVVTDEAQAVLVPVEAITRRKGKTLALVRVMTDGKPVDTETPVVLGGTDGTKQQVLSGLEPGQTVVVGTGASRWAKEAW